MRKALSTALLLISLLGSGNAHAVLATEATQVANGVALTTLQTVNNSLQAAWKAMDEAWQKAKDAFENSVWAQQAKDMYDSLMKLQEQINQIMGLRDDLMGMMTGARDIGGLVGGSEGGGVGGGEGGGADSVDYSYADKLPKTYLPRIRCSGEGSGCTVTGTGYAGIAVSENSADIRNALRVNDAGISLTSVDIRRISNEAAEQNAQEIAIIQAMAQEAYMQANNRIEHIKDLETKISGATSAMNAKAEHGDDAGGGGGTASTKGGTASSPAKNNDLKYIADLQAQIQVQNALLANEQSKLAALAILQQSQRDSYEQRKKEIAAYAINGGDGGGIVETVERAAIAAGQTAAYAAVIALYD